MESRPSAADVLLGDGRDIRSGRRDSVIDRRAFIESLALGAFAGARAAAVQPAAKVYRIGYLSPLFMISQLVGPHPQSPFVKALLDGLRELG